MASCYSWRHWRMHFWCPARMPSKLSLFFYAFIKMLSSCSSRFVFLNVCFKASMICLHISEPVVAVFRALPCYRTTTWLAIMQLYCILMSTCSIMQTSDTEIVVYPIWCKYKLQLWENCKNYCCINYSRIPLRRVWAGHQILFVLSGVGTTKNCLCLCLHYQD